MYEVHVTLAPGLVLGVGADDVDGLVEQYEFLGGDKSWLVDKMREMVPASERGEGVGALSAIIHAEEVIDSEPEEDVAPSGSQATRKVVDPWSDEEVEEPVRRRSAGRTEPSRAKPHPASTPQSTANVHTAEDRFGNKWTTGLPEAPNCDGHDEPAARFKGRSKSGNEYTVFKCARGAPGGDWRSKCDFSEFPN